jgi:hypothetical protein
MLRLLNEGERFQIVETRHEYLKTFDRLSRAAQQRLWARIADANGDIGVVVHEIRLQIEQLDRGMSGRPEHVRRRRLADRAHFVAQLAYLELCEHAQAAAEQRRERGLLRQLRSTIRRAMLAK